MDDDFNLEGIASADRDEQIDAMEQWFRAKYEDPAERTPYESAEGGYIWIWGGPYDAEIELRSEFEDTVPEELIETLASRLSAECPQWAPTAQPDDYDRGLYEAVSSNALARETLDEALNVITNLLSLDVPKSLEPPFMRLLYANTITALETYLSDTFINRVFGDIALLQRYFDFEQKFTQRKVMYKDILREAERVKDVARQELLAVVWHNLGRVKPMYAETLGVDLGEIGAIAAAVQKRHDIVHRNGRQKDGGMVTISRLDIDSLLFEIRELAPRIEIKLDFGIDTFSLDT